MTKAMRVDRTDARLFRSLVEDLVDTAGGHRSLLADPELGEVRVPVLCAGAQVPVERSHRLVPKRTGTRASSLA
jgi:hypothetical protein